MSNYIIKDTVIINEGQRVSGDLLIKNNRIEKIGGVLNTTFDVIEIDGSNQLVLPGCIDDQVHFREPGLTHKATIATEAKAAVAGGVTSFMEMPNTNPPVFTQDLLEDKYQIASQHSLANYSFYMGTSNDNYEAVMQTNNKKNIVCGIKIFMGSSTGNLLVDSPLVLDKIFAGSELLIATHCEDEQTIKSNYASLKEKKQILQPSDHSIIRNDEGCFESSFKAIQFAKKYNTRLHILHISTEKELQLFGNLLPLKQKQITAEVCVHHLHFSANDYDTMGYQIKCNPSIKSANNKEALWEALLDDRLDVIATDHAPHTLAEKGYYRNAAGLLVSNTEVEHLYEHAHAGLPLVQHPLLLMLYYAQQGKISIEKIVEKMSHAVATCFQIKDRGFIREGYFADLVMVDLNKPTTISRNNILYKCGWSPLENFTSPATINCTFINGHLVYENGNFNESNMGMRLHFNRF